MGSVQSPASACDQLVASGFCARLALRHSSALFVPCSALCPSAFLPTFPPRGFARRASRGSSPQQDYAGSDSCRPLARSTGLSAYSPAFRVSRPQPHDVPQTSLSQSPQRVWSGPEGSSASPCGRRLANTPCRSGFVILQTTRSPPVAPTPPRGDAVTLSYAWRDYHAAGTCTLLTQRPHGRTTAGRRPASPW